VWVQCAGKDDIKHNYAATPALWLLHAAAHLDLNVMFCDMPPRDGIPAEYLQRAVSLPPALRKLVTENEPMDPRRYLELLSKVINSTVPCNFMYAIMITPIVAVGNSPDLVAESLRQLLIYRTPHFAAVPRVMHRTPQNDSRADRIMYHGRGVGEVAGGRYSLTARFNGMVERYGGTQQGPTTVASGFGMMLVSRRALKLAVAAAIEAWDASPKDWTFPSRLLSSTHATMDVVIAALRVPTKAVPVSVSIDIGHWPGWSNYERIMMDLARGGRHVKRSASRAGVTNGIYELLPRAMSSDATRERDARPLNAPNETLLRLSNSVSLIWEVDSCGCTTANLATVNHVIAIESRLQVRAVAREGCWCDANFSTSEVHTVQRAMTPKIGGRTAIWISHRPGQLMDWRDYVAEAPYVVLRVTNGVGSAPDASVRESAKRINNDTQLNEVWAPNEQSAAAYRAAGVKRPIFVVPDPIDVYNYGGVVEPSPAVAQQWAGTYKFLTTCDAKDLDRCAGLFQAFFTTFTARDNVVLLIRTHWRADALPHELRQIETILRNSSRANSLSVHAASFVLVDWGTSRLSRAANAPGLYKAADCYVQLARVEGWGQPIREAMASGLPTISPHEGADRDVMTGDFMTVNNSLPIVRRRVANGESPLPLWRNAAKRMRWAVEHQDEARAIGAVGRLAIESHVSREAVAQKLVDRVSDIKRRLDANTPQ
jgi:glycosyltransferase involved in cell wall biosynthesis